MRSVHRNKLSLWLNCRTVRRSCRNETCGACGEARGFNARFVLPHPPTLQSHIVTVVGSLNLSPILLRCDNVRSVEWFTIPHCVHCRTAIRLGTNLAPVPYNVTQFVLVDQANDGLLPNTNHHLLKETIVKSSKKSAPKSSHSSPKLNRNPTLQVR